MCLPLIFLFQDVGDDHVDDQVNSHWEECVPLEERRDEGSGCCPEDYMWQKERKRLE